MIKISNSSRIIRAVAIGPLLLLLCVVRFSSVAAEPEPAEKEKLAAMQHAWAGMQLGLTGNCLQCHSKIYLEEKGALSGNSAWRAWTGGTTEKIPADVTYADMKAMMKFLSEHYGYYHLEHEPKEMARYQRLLRSGILTTAPKMQELGSAPQ